MPLRLLLWRGYTQPCDVRRWNLLLDGVPDLLAVPRWLFLYRKISSGCTMPWRDLLGAKRERVFSVLGRVLLSRTITS